MDLRLGSASRYPFPPVSSRSLYWEMLEKRFLCHFELVGVMQSLQVCGGYFRSGSTNDA